MNDSVAELVEIHPLRLARVELLDFHPEAPGFDTIYGFLVRDGMNCVLVDTGVGVGSALIDRLYRPERVDLGSALAEVGVSLEQITAVVNSHLHFDHCGNNSLFPNVPIYVQREEWEAAHQAHYTVPDWVDFPNAQYVPVQGKHSIAPHLELIPTPGHTPGHQSLLMRCGSHVEAIIAQAAYTAPEFEVFQNGLLEDKGEDDYAAQQAFIESNAVWSRESYVESLGRLHDLRPQRAYFSHDPTVWAPQD